MVSVGLAYEPSLTAMLPGHHNSFGGPFYTAGQNSYPSHQEYGFQFPSLGSETMMQQQSWHIPHYQTQSSRTSNCEWTFPQTNFIPSAPSFRDSCLDGLETPISVSTEPLPGSPQSAIISSTHSPGESSPKSFSRYTCYDWAKRPDRDDSPSDPVPNKSGKTRTKDKYRVVYTDIQRLELEKEFHYSRYITINRKAELSKSLDLSERQIKIWFQNRRAKERKINKKQNGTKQELDSLHASPVEPPMTSVRSDPPHMHRPEPPHVTSLPMSLRPEPHYQMSYYQQTWT